MIGALWVCERDVRKFVHQPFMMGVALIGPFLMLILLGYAFGGAVENVPIAIVKQSQGATSDRILDAIIADKTFRRTQVQDLNSARRMLEQGRVRAILYIPSGFDTAIDHGNQAFVELYLDNMDPVSSSAIRGALSRIVSETARPEEVAIRPVLGGVVLDVAEYYRKVEYVEFMAPGSIIQALFIASMMGGGISIIMDRQRGVIEGYLVTPLKQAEIIVGVLLAGLIKAIFSASGMLILAVLFAGVRPNTTLPGVILTSTTILLTGLGLISMMTALAVRTPVAEVYQLSVVPINMILYFASGAVYPIEGFPSWMRMIASVNPEAYAVHALRQIMYKSADLAAVAGDFAFLVVFTCLMCFLATVAFKRAL